MTDRKRYSKRREENLYRVIQAEITKIRVEILRGAFEGFNERGKDDKFVNLSLDIGKKVCAEYRKCYAPKKAE